VSRNKPEGRKVWNTRGVAFAGIVSFLRAPICSDLDELDADFAVIGAPYDEGTPWYSGSRFAPRAIRELSVRLVSPIDASKGFYDLENDTHALERELRLARVADCGDVEIVYTNPIKTFENITASIRRILNTGAMPVVIGGDHAVAYGVVRAFDRRLDVIHFDAHLDYADFVHGGPLQPNSNPMRLISKLDHVGRIVQVGMRRNTKIRQSDLYDSRSHGNDIVTVNQLRQRGVASVLGHLASGGPVYVSIDIDVLDMPLVPGCGSGEASGLEYDELRAALEYVAAHHEVVGFDLVEVNPLLDVPARNTSYLAAQIMMEFMGGIAENPAWKSAHRVDGAAGVSRRARPQRTNGRLAQRTVASPVPESPLAAPKRSRAATRAAGKGRS
jgi:agmatinase